MLDSTTVFDQNMTSWCQLLYTTNLFRKFHNHYKQMYVVITVEAAYQERKLLSLTLDGLKRADVTSVPLILTNN